MTKPLVTTLLITMLAFAVSAKTKAIVKLEPLPAPPSFNLMSEEQYHAEMKAAKSGTRRVADIDKVNDSEALSDSLKNLRSALIGGPLWKNRKMDGGHALAGVKNVEDLVNLIKNLEGKSPSATVNLAYDGLDTDAKFVAAQLIALKPFQSAIYRMRHLIDHADISKATIVTMLRLSATGQNAFFPTEQNKVAFDYLVTPTAGMGPDIVNEEDLHSFIVKEVRPYVENLYSRVNDLKFSTPVYLDNKMIYADANFVSDDDRYSILGETERKAALSGIAFSISAMYNSIAYNWLGMFDTADAIARVYGFRTMVGGDIGGAGTADRRTSIIRKNSSLFTLRQGGEGWTTKAYDWFVLGVRMANITWAAIKSDGASGSNLNKLIDPRGLLPFTRQIDTSLINLEAMIGSEPVSSAVVQGESVDVKFKELFTNPPRDLKVFLPTKFIGGNDLISSPYAREAGGYRNYLKGSPSEWCIKDCKGSNNQPAQSYGDYFPNVKSSANVKEAARILSQTWGGWLVGMPMGAMLF